MPSWRYARVVSPIAWVGKSAKQIEMSIAVMTNSTAFANVAASNVSSSFRNFNRLSEARLHEELSRCMYSLHGLDAVMRPVFDAVCQRLIVVSNCMPGSAHCHDDSEICRNSSRAFTVRIGSPVVTERSAHS